MKVFYSKLLSQESLWRDKNPQKGILRTRPIIRLENGEHIAPYDEDGRLIAYLPVEGKTEYKTVKRSIARNEDAEKFLIALGLSKPDQFAEIREFIIPRYKNEERSLESDYENDFEKLLTGYANVSQNYKNTYISDLRELSFIDGVNKNNGMHKLCKPSEIYYPVKNLVDYFSFTGDIYFVSDQLIQRFTEERLLKFLLDLGVSTSPRRIKIQGKLSMQEKLKMATGGITYTIHDLDYELEGLDNFLKILDPGASFLLCKRGQITLGILIIPKPRKFSIEEISCIRTALIFDTLQYNLPKKERSSWIKYL